MDGIFYQVGSTLDIQLPHNIGPVIFYRANANKQEISDLFVGDSFSNKLQDLSFTCG